jgi:hypothetical protein
MIKHDWIWDDWEDQDGNLTSDMYCCKCYQPRDFNKSEEEEGSCSECT